MSHHYTFTNVGILHPGYNFRLEISQSELTDLIVPGRPVQYSFRIIKEGKLDREVSGEVDQNYFQIPAMIVEAENDNSPRYFEMDFKSMGDEPGLTRNIPMFSYGLYWALGKKSFTVETGLKFGDPRMVMQRREFGNFLLTYCAALVDLDKDVSESLSIINPYRMPTLISIVAGDRKLPHVKLAPLSAAYIRLDQLLEKNERRWMGDLQIFGPNRIISWMVKHRQSDPSIIVDHEHMDWFQGAQTGKPMAMYYADQLARKLIRVGLKRYKPADAL